MSFDYAASRATADRLIERFGTVFTLLRAGSATGDAWNPVASAPASHAIIAVEIDEARRPHRDRGRGEPAHVRAGDGIIPIVGDTIDGAEVTEVRPLSPARIDVLYAVGLAR